MKRMIAGALSLCLVFGMAPLNAMAQEAEVIKEIPDAEEEITEDSEMEEITDTADDEMDEVVEQDAASIAETDLDVPSTEEFSVTAEVEGQSIEDYLDGTTHYLFLPNTDTFDVTISYTGNMESVSEGILDTEAKTVTVTVETEKELMFQDGETTYPVVLKRSNLPSCSVILNGVDLATIHKDKNVKYKGNTVRLSGTANALIEENVEVKGRGNFSWTQVPKKGYQIKFASKKNVLGMGNAKTWVLIAGYGDNTLMRNKLMLDMANELGMPYTSCGEWVDLWIDGEYLGNYLICEKVQVNKERVNLKQEDGILLEMDNNYYATETNYFTSQTSQNHFVLKDSVADDEGETDSKAEAAFAEAEQYVNEFETYLYAEDKDWDKIISYIDVDSFIYYYFMQEFAENADGCRSSMFYYKDGSGDVLHAGPIWDFDLALANCDKENWGGNPEIDYIMDIQRYMVKSITWYTELFQIPEFRTRAVEIYNTKIKPVFDGAVTKANVYQSQLTRSAEMNFIRWNTLGKENAFGSYRGHTIKATWEEECDYLRNWMGNRTAYLNERYSPQSGIARIRYRASVENSGWESEFAFNGEDAGTTGKSNAINDIQVYADSFCTSDEIAESLKYRVCDMNGSWREWKNSTTSDNAEASKIEAFEIQLSGPLAEKYDVYYRAHVQNYGWLDWAKNGESAGTKGMSKRMEAFQMVLVEKNGSAPGDTACAYINGDYQISYSTHVQKVGWTKVAGDGQVCGTTGSGKRMEAIKISISDSEISGNVEYSSHVQGIGWQDWKSDGQLSGTNGQSKRLEAIKIKLSGDAEEQYDIYYRVHVQNFGWLDWASNGEAAGSEGYSKRLEAIQIKLVEKGKAAPGKTGQPFKQAKLTYATHIQGIGWQKYMFDGEESGTSGQSKRLEAIRIMNKDKTVSGSVLYKTQIQTYGWEKTWKKDGELSGTSGKSKRLEAIQIKLSGELAEKYDVYYRVHAQNFGWLGWACNGEPAGTEGLSKRLEAIQIILVEKGEEAPRSTDNSFVKK